MNREEGGPIQEIGLDRKFSFKFSDTTTFKKKMSNFNSINKNPIEHCVTTAYWCRDQNFRKYFEMRKKNGISPSVNESSYYNKKLGRKFANNHSELYKFIRSVEHPQKD
jgi:hypothetical protein